MERFVTTTILDSWQGAAMVWSLGYRGPLCVLWLRLQPDDHPRLTSLRGFHSGPVASSFEATISSSCWWGECQTLGLPVVVKCLDTCQKNASRVVSA